MKLKVSLIILLNTVFSLGSKAQCTFTNIQDDLCNSNGIIQIIFDQALVTAPYEVSIVFPNGSLSDIITSLDTFNLEGLSGGVYEFDVVGSVPGQVCDGSASIVTESLATSIFSASAFANNGYNTSCFGTCDANVSVGVIGVGTNVYTADWYADSVFGTPFFSETSNNTSQSGLCAGQYVVVLTSPSGCANVRPLVLTEPDSLQLAAVTSEVSCLGQSQGSIDITVTGGVGDVINPNNGSVIGNLPFNFNWTSTTGLTSNDEDLTNLLAGDYTLEVTDANGCAITDVYSILDTIPLLEIQLVSVDSVSCFGGSNGSIEVSATGGTPGYQFSIDGGPDQESPVFTDLSAGTYLLTVTDVNSCFASISIEVQQYEQLFFDEVMHQDIFCADSLGSFELQGFGGSGSYNFTIDVQQETGLYEDLVADNYTVTMFDDFNCFTDTTIVILETPSLLLDIVSNDPSCFGFTDGSFAITVFGGTPTYDYTLNTIDQTNGNFNGLTDGFYNLSVTDDNGCSIDTILSITEPTEVVAELDSLFNLSCFNSDDGAIYTNASGGSGNYEYFWLKDNAPFLFITDDLQNLAASLYTLEVTDGSNCSSEQYDFTITQPDTLIINTLVQQDLSCDESNDGRIEVSGTGGTGSYSFQWSGLNTSQDLLIQNLVQGDYTVDLLDDNSCLSSLTFTINQPDTISFLNIISDVDCNGSNTGSILVNTNGGTPNFTFSILPDIGTQTSGINFDVQGLSAQTYTVSLIDDNGCFFEEDIEVFENEPLEATVEAVSETCNLDNASASVNVSGGLPNYNYSWPGFTETSSTLSSISGGLTYSVDVTDALNCTETFSIFVPELQSVSITDVTVNNPTCFAFSDGSIEVTADNGLLPYTFNLFEGTTLITSIVSNTNTAILDSLSVANYTLSVEDASACAYNWNEVLEVASPSDLLVNINTNKTTFELDCFGDNNGEIFLNISGGNPFNGEFYWLFVNDPNFSQQISADSITGLDEGLYDLTIQDANGCFTSITHAIAEPEQVSVASFVTTVGCYGDSTGEANVVVEGGIPNYSLTTISQNAIITQLSTDTFRLTNLSEGQYFVDVVDSKGCENLNNSFYVSQPTLLEVLNTSSTLESCLTGDGTASVSVAGGSEPYQYLWTYDSDFQLPILLTNGVVNPTSQDINAQQLSQGLHYIHIWDARGCYTYDSVVVNIATSPALSLLGTVNNICHDGEAGQISLNAIQGNPFYQFSIDGGINWQFSPAFSNLSEGLYNATVRDSLGCSDQVENIVVGAPEPIDVIVSTQNVSCFQSNDGTASVTSVEGGTGSYTYNWQNESGVNLWPGNLSAISQTVNGLLPANYQLVVEDENECISTYGPVVIGEPLKVNVALDIISDHNGLNISCFDGSDGSIMATAGGGTGDFTFSWSSDLGSIETNTAATFDSIFFLSQGVYYVNVVDENGCSSSDEITIDQPSQIIVDFENIINIRCEGEAAGEATALWSGGLGFGIYNVVWTDSIANVLSLSSTINNLDVGQYFATVSDQNGCFNTDSITIDYSELFAITNTDETTNVSCFGQNDASFDFNPTGGWLPYSHDWNDPLNQQSSTAVGLIPGQWYIDVITDAQGCVVYDSVFVTEPTQLTLEGSTTGVDCFGNDSGTMTLSASGGSPTYNYQWTGPATDNIISDQEINVNSLEAGMYNVTITDSEGCQVFETFVIDQVSSPLQVNQVTIEQHVQCFGAKDGIATFNLGDVTGGTPVAGQSPPYYFDWDGENPFELSAGEYDVVVTDDNGCSVQVSYLINEPAKIVVNDINLVNENCAGDNGAIIVQASGGTPFASGFYNYSIDSDYQTSSISDPNIVVDFPFPAEGADTIFALTLTDANGCIYEEEGLQLHASRIFQYNAYADVCLGDTFEINVVHGNFNSFTWQTSNQQALDVSQSTNSVSFVSQESLVVSATGVDNYGCSFTDDFTINVLVPQVDILEGEEVGIIRGEEVTLNVSGEAPYFWSNLETTASITVSPLATTHYMVYALDNSVGCVGSDSVRVFVGMNEGFSPNGDGFNDTWEIDYLNELASVRIELFNRYGSKLWESDSPNITNWDGTYNGSEMPVGTYYYLITFDESSNKEPLTGPVTIVR